MVLEFISIYCFASIKVLGEPKAVRVCFELIQILYTNSRFFFKEKFKIFLPKKCLQTPIVQLIQALKWFW